MPFEENATYSCRNGEYYVKATGMKLLTAMTTLAHLHSKKFRASGAEVPKCVIETLQREVELEKEAAKANKKRKGQEQRVKKKMRLMEQYNQAHRVTGNLYTKLTKDGAVVYDCAGCKKLVPDYAFASHTAMDHHKEALHAAGFVEDVGFIEAEKSHVKDAIREKAECIWCTPCEKWVSKFNYQAHCTGKSHRAKTRTAAEANTENGVDFVPAEEPMFNVFCYKADMWEMSAEYEDVAVATVTGYKTVCFGEDATEYGTAEHPACGLAMVKDGMSESLGVCYTVTDRVLEDMRGFPMYKNHELVEVQVKIDQIEQHAYTFIPKNAVKWKTATVATRLAKAVGPKGPGYTLLAKIVHEHQKQDWHDKYLKEVVAQTEKLLWS